MSDEQVSVKLSILDREYQVSCREKETDALLEAAEYIHNKMVDIRSRGKFIGTDRLATVTALNIAHELLQLKHQQADDGQIHQQLDDLQLKIQHALDADAEPQEINDKSSL
ncbi:MAG: cell division protein ZapA [Gammaproteobacteria bacterium]|nr:cell division protein ZapA [Gammaproteobacteria bacterium]